MSERPTPETDAFSNRSFKHRSDELEKLYDHAKYLERERDEAKEAFIIATDQAFLAQSKTREALRERDEARNLFESSKRARASLNEALDKTLHELREAREDLEFRRGLYKAQEECLEKARRERDEAREEREQFKQLLAADSENADAYLGVCIERDEARELCRELADLVAYGLGQSGEPWSLDAMRQAYYAIHKAKQMGTLPTD